MHNKWVLYHGYKIEEEEKEKIHPDDLEDFINKMMSGVLAYECVSNDTEYMVLRHCDRLYKVKKAFGSPIFLSAPAFDFGQKVKLKDHPDAEVVITNMWWHFKQEEYFYYVTLDGKKKSKRYFESEFIK